MKNIIKQISFSLLMAPALSIAVDYPEIEPNNFWGEAQTLAGNPIFTTSDAFLGNIDRPGGDDSDLIRLRTVKPATGSVRIVRYIFNLKTSDGTDSYFSMYSDGGYPEIARSDNYYGLGLMSRIRFDHFSTGAEDDMIWNLEISGAYRTKFHYVLQHWTEEVAITDLGVISPGSRALSFPHQPGDGHWYSFTIEQPMRVRLHNFGTEATNPVANTSMGLFASDGLLLVEGEEVFHTSPAGFGYIAQVATELQPGTYYVTVSEEHSFRDQIDGIACNEWDRRGMGLGELGRFNSFELHIEASAL